MQKKRVLSGAMLVLAAIIWGGSFVAQSVGLEKVGPYTMNAVRLLIGGVVLLPVIFFGRRLRHAGKRTPAQWKRLLTAGALCGAAVACASTLQQFGLIYTTAGKSAFVTTLYVVLVPIFGLALRRFAGWNVWVGVALAVAGLYFLCVGGVKEINLGDMLTLACAVFFAVHILLIDHFSEDVDGVELSCVQFFAAGLICLVLMFIFERPTVAQIVSCRWPILYAGVLSCGVAYTCQVVGQKNTDPTVASLLMSLESVFAALFGFLFLQEHLSAQEWIGCALMLVAIVIAQLPLDAMRHHRRPAQPQITDAVK